MIATSRETALHLSLDLIGNSSADRSKQDIEIASFQVQAPETIDVDTLHMHVHEGSRIIIFYCASLGPRLHTAKRHCD
jgi:hypothetical protein